MTVDEGFQALLLGANRVLLYAGYVLFAGTSMFWLLVWPGGRREVLLPRLARLGATLLALTTVTGLLLRMLGGDPLLVVENRVMLVAALIRLACLFTALGFLGDLVRGTLTGSRRVVLVLLVVVVAATLVAQSNAIVAPYVITKIIATTGHVLATAAWLGGLVALAAVILPRDNIPVLDEVIPRFSRVALVSVIVLVGTGAVHAVAVAGGPVALVTSWYGWVFGVKLAVFALMLLLGNHGRKYAANVAFRKLRTAQQKHRSEGVHALAVVMGAELAIAFAVLAATSVLVAVAPG